MDKRLALILIAIFCLAFLAGRYSAPVRTKIETRTEIKTEVIKDEHKAVDTSQSVTEVTRPNGTKIKRTKVTTSERLDNRALERVIQAETKKTEIETRKGVIVSVTATKQLNDILNPPVLGASVMFPIMLGLYGGALIQMNSTVGVSLGWGF